MTRREMVVKLRCLHLEYRILKNHLFDIIERSEYKIMRVYNFYNQSTKPYIGYWASRHRQIKQSLRDIRKNSGFYITHEHITNVKQKIKEAQKQLAEYDKMK